MGKGWQCALLGAVLAVSSMGAMAQADVRSFVKRDAFGEMKISPDGQYYAATVVHEDRTALVIMRRADKVVTGSISLGKNSHVHEFWWVNPERVVFSVAEKLGMLDQPQLTGELFALNADGSKKENLLGYRVAPTSQATHIKPKKVEDVSGYMVDTLPDDDRNVVITVRPFGDHQYTRAEKLDVYSGRRTVLARSPVPEARFITDANGVVRFAYGLTADNTNTLYHREGDGKDWQLINDESVTHRVEWPAGFSADGSKVYLISEQATGTDAVVALDPNSGARTVVLRDPNVDPADIIESLDGRGRVIGVTFRDGRPVNAYFDEESTESRLRRSMSAAFPDADVVVTSQTQDGSLALVQVSSDRNPGDYYVFDVKAKQMSYLLSRREWLDPDRMVSVKPIQLKARDGLALHGLLTQPTQGTALPMVMLVHGGPFGVRDDWGFNEEVQMLAAAGYAVLQVNFRGSGGYGRDFETAGARQWGGTMQDDVTDATRWAIQQGIADPKRICIYGASYGAYAALMGAAKEPGLYRCAVGYVGVYDLPLMHRVGDVQGRRTGRAYLADWLGDPTTLSAVSPVNLADRIRIPVMLAGGGEDRRAPVEHTELMERRLKSANASVETIYYKNEGHGFYMQSNQQEYYTRLLAFFDKHIGATSPQ